MGSAESDWCVWTLFKWIIQRGNPESDLFSKARYLMRCNFLCTKLQLHHIINAEWWILKHSGVTDSGRNFNHDGRFSMNVFTRGLKDLSWLCYEHDCVTDIHTLGSHTLRRSERCMREPWEGVLRLRFGRSTGSRHSAGEPHCQID